MSEYPTLIAVAHGTRSPAGRRQIEELAASVARRRPGLDVRLCYVDVQEPKVADVVAGVINEQKTRRGETGGYGPLGRHDDSARYGEASRRGDSGRFGEARESGEAGRFGEARGSGEAGRFGEARESGDAGRFGVVGGNGDAGRFGGAGGYGAAGGYEQVGSDFRLPGAVVVPLLLSAGYHVRVDIAEAVAGTGFAVTAPLGPDDVFLESLRRNLPAAADATVLASAGSSDPLWVQGIREVAAELPGRVELGYTSGSGPRVADVVAKLRADGARNIAIAAYLLAEGLFYRTLHQAGADSVTPALCHGEQVADLVLRRFDSAILTTVGSAL